MKEQLPQCGLLGSEPSPCRPTRGRSGHQGGVPWCPPRCLVEGLPVPTSKSGLLKPQI